MDVLDLKKQYNLSRQAAGRLLKVSVRTVDRYLKSKKLSSCVVDGRVWLDKEEIERFRFGKSGAFVDVSTSKMSIENSVDSVDEVEVMEDDMSTPLSTKRRRNAPEEAVYQKLFEELKQELTEKQERLEIANYRVGQLESQIRQSIPMLQYHKESFEHEKIREDLGEKLTQSTDIIKSLQLKLKHLNYNKRIFLAILLIVLALQPLWLIIRFG